MDAPAEEATQEVPAELEVEHQPPNDVDFVYVVLGIGIVILIAWIRTVEMAFRIL